ncbi:TPA: metalloprotease TldD [Photobacterium damselae]|uniref:TldD protein probably a protease n=5 Tax=Photobacterium damselae TaxID=38293 RepID=D0Z1U6_PHODD|nr:metalloprotease TldD [Photobacterium damselae]AWK80920.1 metalloprotease TldD [Photobacterium damselae]EEZ42477.1 TldD protein probably a protease [Photobacterium damselae subsp. damselae CIP 102761]EHA1081640.1 metalloprotease TldD [Photobacterium damselae]EJN6960731.1 metalloprotease TldD [Photobacterium damselae]ELI6447882.1 metalloprotease TldD [Photobacterium damselae]
MTLNTVEKTMLAQADMGQDELQAILAKIATRDVDYADIYFQSCWHESLVLEDSIIKDGSFNIDRGVGVRAISGEKTGFAYSDQINLLALEQSAKAARGIARQGRSAQVQAFVPVTASGIYAPVDPLTTMDKQQKIELLQQIDSYIRTKEPLVTEVSVSINGVNEQILVAGLDGTYAADVRPLVRLSISVLVERGDKRERGSAGGGGRYGYQAFLAEDENGKSVALHFADEAIRQALVSLEAQAAPAGTMPVVLGAGWPGVLLHEAVGHGLEGDFNRKGSSMFSGQLGEQVTSSLCTIVDDGTLPDLRGSINVDDEGTPGQYNVLVEGGKLKGYMQDKHNARLMGVAPTGNGRRESYAHLPMPRMTNTYMLPGEHSPEEIIASVKKGIYAPNFGGGQVDITSGKFVFSASEAYLIENGKITTPIKGATLVGSGIEAMQQVSMVGNDLQIDKGVGVCGKAGQSIPVGVGQPTLKLDSMTVGGTQ